MSKHKPPMSQAARALRNKLIELNGRKIRKERLKVEPGKYFPGMPSKLFYSTKEWKSIRYDVIAENKKKWSDGKARCELCGAPAGTVVIQVDHIRPRSKYPHLELSKLNLRVTCSDCNQGKSAKLEV